jgi:hypothetical protein
MQVTYNYILETNRVCRVYSAAAVVTVQFVLHVTLFRPWNVFCSFTLALPVVCVQCPIWPFFLKIKAHTPSCLLNVFLFPVLRSVIWCVPLSHHIISRVFICYLFLFVIFLSHDIWFCNAWSCAAIISLLVSPFRTPLDSHRNLSSWLKSVYP